MATHTFSNANSVTRSVEKILTRIHKKRDSGFSEGEINFEAKSKVKTPFSTYLGLAPITTGARARRLEVESLGLSIPLDPWAAAPLDVALKWKGVAPPATLGTRRPLTNGKFPKKQKPKGVEYQFYLGLGGPITSIDREEPENEAEYVDDNKVVDYQSLLKLDISDDFSDTSTLVDEDDCAEHNELSEETVNKETVDVYPEIKEWKFELPVEEEKSEELELESQFNFSKSNLQHIYEVTL